MEGYNPDAPEGITPLEQERALEEYREWVVRLLTQRNSMQDFLREKGLLEEYNATIPPD